MTREAVSAVKPTVRAQTKTGKVHGAASAAVLKGLVYGAAVLTFAVLLFLIGYILVTGIPHLKPSLFQWNYTSENVSMMPAILTTVETTALALLLAVPLGLFTAVYLNEYAKRGNKLVNVIRITTETLSGIPSIIYGLVGMLFFCEFLGMQTSLLAGALTLVIMNLPTVLRTTQESLRTVPQSYREGAFGLGAGKWRVVRTVVLPGCIDGIVTGCILSAGRILGESAALLFTAGFAHTLNKFVIGLASPGATLTVALYAYAKEEGEFDVAFAIAAILMILTLLINLAAGIVGKQIQKRSQQ